VGLALKADSVGAGGGGRGVQRQHVCMRGGSYGRKRCATSITTVASRRGRRRPAALLLRKAAGRSSKAAQRANGALSYRFSAHYRRPPGGGGYQRRMGGSWTEDGTERQLHLSRRGCGSSHLPHSSTATIRTRRGGAQHAPRHHHHLPERRAYTSGCCANAAPGTLNSMFLRALPPRALASRLFTICGVLSANITPLGTVAPLHHRHVSGVLC